MATYSYNRKRTLAQIIDRAFRLCGFYKQGRGSTLWSAEEVQDAANDLVLELAMDYGLLRSEAVIHLVDGTAVYDLPPDCIRLLRVQLHGPGGTIVLPTTISRMDVLGEYRSSEGDPYEFYREFLAPNQIGFIPTPTDTGSTTTRDSNYGLLRRILESGQAMPFDANQALRDIRGLSFSRTGSGEIIRDVVSPWGNILVSYIRSPISMKKMGDYPDSGIPDFLHCKIPYGVASKLLRTRKDKLSRMKLKRFSEKWEAAKFDARGAVEQHGPIREVRPA